MPGRFTWGTLIAVALVGAVAASSAQAATVTIGQLFAPSGSCSGFTILQTSVASGTPYAAPAPGVITSWSFQTDAATTPGLKFKVGRSAANGSYKIIAEAPAGTQTPSAVNTYPVSIPVQAGDLIGVYSTSGNCGDVTGNPSDVIAGAMSDAAPGTTTSYESAPNDKVEVSARETLQPGITSLAPSQGPVAGGTTVTITGHDFTGATAVRFGDEPAVGFTVNSDTSITATAPATTAGPVDVTVTTPGGQSPTTPPDRFNYSMPPVITSVFPAHGPRSGGTQVTITGHGFTGATRVSFGGLPAAGFGIISDTVITAVTPAARAGRVDVTVSGTGGLTAITPADRFTFTPACVVPRLIGKSITSARNALVAAHCALGTVKGRRPGKVRRQSRKAGTFLPAGTKVNVRVGRRHR